MTMIDEMTQNERQWLAEELNSIAAMRRNEFRIEEDMHKVIIRALCSSQSVMKEHLLDAIADASAKEWTDKIYDSECGPWQRVIYGISSAIEGQTVGSDDVLKTMRALRYLSGLEEHFMRMWYEYVSDHVQKMKHLILEDLEVKEAA